MIQIYYVKKNMKNIFYTFLSFAFLCYLNVLYSIISLFTSLLQHKISRSKPIARFFARTCATMETGCDGCTHCTLCEDVSDSNAVPLSRIDDCDSWYDVNI